MGNALSGARTGERPQNRLSKSPTYLPPLFAGSSDLDDATRFTLKGPWDAAIESPKIPPLCGDKPPDSVSAGGLGEMDFELRPGKRSPSTLSVRVGDLKRRFSVPCKPKRISRLSIDAKLEEEKLAPMMDRRATVLDPLNANPGPSVTFADDTHFGNQAKRHSAFRRLSLRAPGIARVSEKLTPPKRSPETLRYEDDFHMYTDDQFTPEELLCLDVGTRPSTSPAPSFRRASTPNDFEYSYLGGLKLGSLHVVNGAASPAPSSAVRSFPESTVLSLSRDDLRGPLRYGSSPDTILEGVSQIPSRQRFAETNVAEDNAEVEFEIEPSQDVPNGKSCDTSEPSMFVLDCDGVGVDASDDAPEPVAPLVTSKPDAAEDDLFDEAVDTSMPQEEASPEQPNTDTSQSTKRKGTVSGLSKSDSGYSSASSKYPYSLRRRRTSYGPSGCAHCMTARPPPMPEITISPPQTPSNDPGPFAGMSPYTPPDLTLTFPRGNYPPCHALLFPRIDTKIPSCDDFLESCFPERKMQPGVLKGHKSWPLTPCDVTHTMPTAIGTPEIIPDQTTQDVSPPSSNPPKAAKLTKAAPPPPPCRRCARKFVTRMKSFVNLRKQCRRHAVHALSEEADGEDETANEKKQRVPNKLQRRSTRYDNLSGQLQTVKT